MAVVHLERFQLEILRGLSMQTVVQVTHALASLHQIHASLKIPLEGIGCASLWENRDLKGARMFAYLMMNLWMFNSREVGVDVAILVHHPHPLQMKLYPFN